MSQILYIAESDLAHPGVIPFIHGQRDQEDYWSDNWSPSFYAGLAYEGLISITIPDPANDRHVLLSQMQCSYALLDWKDLHMSSHVRRLLRPSSSRRFQLRISGDLMPAIERIRACHRDCWLTEEYEGLLFRLRERDDRRCRLFGVELLEEGRLVAGEIGYATGAVFTSLSGFSNQAKGAANRGTLQLVLLGRLLERKGFAFWNLGHPYMEYKVRLGAEVLERSDFLDRWKGARDRAAEDPSGVFSAADLVSF